MKRRYLIMVVFTPGDSVSILMDEEMGSPDTHVFGDIDAFVDYIEMGHAWRDWQEQMAAAAKERERFFRQHRRAWSHIVSVQAWERRA